MPCRARSLWPLKPHEVGNDLREAPLPGVQVEREGGQLVDERDGGWIRREFDAEQIAPARFATFDTYVGKDGLVRSHAMVADPAFQPAHDAPALTGRGPFFAEDRESRARVFAAAGARHARVPPAAVTARAEEKAAAGRKVFTRKREVAELRRSSTAGAVEMVADSSARCRGLWSERFEHRAHRRAGQEPIDHRLLVAL